MRRTILACVLFVASCTSLPIDPSASAAGSNDATLYLMGCGVVPQDVGFLPCRRTAGSLSLGSVTMIVPRGTCSRDACGEYTVYGLDGSPVTSGGIPKGNDRAEIKIADIVKSETITDDDDGEYPVVMDLYYDIGGHEQKITAVGFFRLVVMSPGYRPLGCGSPHIAWEIEIDREKRLEVTSSYRSAVCGD